MPGKVESMKGNIIKRAGLALGVLETVPTGSASLDGKALIPKRSAVSGDVKSLDAVYRALFVLETACKQLSVDVWRGKKQIDPPSIVRQPDLSQTQKAFIAETVNALAQDGNAFWVKQVNAAGEVFGVRSLNPTLVHVSRDKNEKLVYSYGDKILNARRVIHLKLTHQPGELRGLSPITACMQTLQGALELRQYADNWTSASGRPTGILSTDQVMTAEQSKKWKEQANKSLTPEQGVAVFGNGLKYQPLLLTPEQLQFLEAQNANVTAVARMFGIPARLIMASVPGGSQTYANLEQDELTFLRYTIMAYLSEIESAFDQLLPHNNIARFNLDALLRTDTKTRYEAHQIGLNSGFLTKSEVRDIEGLPALEEQEDED